MKELSEFTINKDATCLDGLKKLDVVQFSQTLFVIENNGKLISTVTDGDIRRGLLKGLKLDSPIHLFGYSDFCYIKGKIDVYEIHRLKKKGIKVLPKLTPDGRIEEIFDLAMMNSILPLDAVIIAGGRGERLRPLTDSIPKPMLPLGNKPILEYIIDRLISYGIEHISISVNYLAEKIIDYFGDGSSKGITISYIVEKEPLGTIGCLSIIDHFFNQSVLALNSDVFTNINLEDLYLNFINSKADIAVASIPYSVDIPYAIMELREDRIMSFQEKPKTTYYANAGIYLIKKEAISLIPKNNYFNATDLLDRIIANQGKLIHSPITGYWIDIGKYDDYNKAMEIVKHL